MGKRLGGLLDRWFGRDDSTLALGKDGGATRDALGLRDESSGPGESRRTIARETVSRTETLRWGSSDGAEQSATVEVEDDSRIGVRVLAPSELAIGETVWLTFCGDVEKCVVRHCEPVEGGYAAGLYRVREERRREDREVVEGKANLFWGSVGSEICLIEVEVRDISAGGMQILSCRSIPLQTAVRVAGEDYACLGITSYCRAEGERYAVGIQFTQEPYYKESAEYDG